MDKRILRRLEAVSKKIETAHAKGRTTQGSANTAVKSIIQDLTAKKGKKS